MMILPEPAMIIFDLDGTLVDTETQHTKAFHDMFIERGIAVDYDILHDMIAAKTLGVSFDLCRTALGWPSFGAAEEVEYVQRFRQSLIDAGDAIAIPGARNIVATCAAHLPVAIATNGEPDLSDIKMRGCGYFEILSGIRLFTKDVVPNPKPAPDLFLHVAREFGVHPSECWVVEDSETGATAGLAAGMSVIGFVGCAHHPDTARQKLIDLGVTLVIDDYKDFPTLPDKALLSA